MPRCVCVCRGGGERPRGGRARARSAGGRRAAQAPGLGAPSAARGTSPLLAPAVPGHLPPSAPLRVGWGRGANYWAAARAGGRGREAVFRSPRRANASSTFPPPAPPPPPALLPPAAAGSFSPPPAAATAAAAPPTTSGQLGRSRLRESSAVSATPPSSPPREARERRLRQTSACSRPPLPLRPGLLAPRPVKPFRLLLSSLSNPATPVPL